MWRRSTASGSVQETSRGVDAFVREPGGELAQRSSAGAGARLMDSAVPPPVESLTVLRPRRTADGDRNKSRRDRDRAPDDGGECRCGGVRARRCRGDFPWSFDAKAKTAPFRPGFAIAGTNTRSR